MRLRCCRLLRLRTRGPPAADASGDRLDGGDRPAAAGALGRHLDGVGRFQGLDLIGQFVGRGMRFGAFLDRLVRQYGLETVTKDVS